MSWFAERPSTRTDSTLPSRPRSRQVRWSAAYAEAIVFRPRPWSAVGGRPARPHPGWPDCCPPARGSRSTPNRS